MQKQTAGTDSVDVLFQSLDLLDDADEMTSDAETLAAAIRELEQRVASGRITRDDRTDLGGDMLALAESLTAFALRVLA